MKIKAIINFVDGSGIERNIGDEWYVSCRACAIQMITEGKAVKSE